MTVLFGHPTGNPNSHQAALAHYEAGTLAAFCVPWMPARSTIRFLERAAPDSNLVRRFSRRYFPPLVDAPKVQGRTGEIRRLMMRMISRNDGERFSYEANDWLMRTMARESRRDGVRAVHSYEDCSLWQFEEAKRNGQACIYDMPIGFYPAWEETQSALARKWADWLPPGGLPSNRHVRPQQKRREMELADLVLVPGSFVEQTVRRFCDDKRIGRAQYGVDLDFWQPKEHNNEGRLRFIYAGQISLRKGIPLLLEAWQAAGLHDAELQLVGMWQLAESKRALLPPNVFHCPQCSRQDLREHYRGADVFVFPSFFEGFALAFLEALASGLPAIATEAASGRDVLDDSCGRLIPTGDADALVSALRWFADHRECLPVMRRAARARAERFTWAAYRQSVKQCVAPFV